MTLSRTFCELPMVRETSKKRYAEEMTPRLPEKDQIIRDTCDLECLLAKRPFAEVWQFAGSIIVLSLGRR